MWNIDRTHGDIFSKAPKLGPAIISSSITPPDQNHGPPIVFDATEDSNLNSKYVLSGGERRYAKTGYSEESSDHNEAILEKRDLLPERIQHLIDDVSVLHTSPYLSSEDWDDGIVQRKQTRSKYSEIHRQLRDDDTDISDIDSGELGEVDIDYYETPYDSPANLWRDLIDVSERGQQVRDDVFFHGDAALSKEAQFGFEIGSLLQMLRPNQDDENVEAIDLIWGFMLAFLGNSHADVDQERDKLDDLVNEIENRHDTRTKEAERLPKPKELASLKPDFHDATVAAVEEKGFAANPVLLREIIYHQPPAAESEMAHKQAVKNLVEELADIVPLREMNCLAHAVSSDIHTLQNKNPSGVESVRSLLLSTWDNLNETTVSDNAAGEAAEPAANRHGPKKSTYNQQSLSNIVGCGEWNQSSVTTVFNRLSESEDAPQWTTASVLDKIDGSGNKISWQFTPYGGLLTHILNDKDGETDLLYWYALGPEELSLFERRLVLDSLDYLDFLDAGPTYREP